MSTFIMGIIVAAILFMAGRQIYKDKKAGKSACGGNCANCMGCTHSSNFSGSKKV